MYSCDGGGGMYIYMYVSAFVYVLCVWWDGCVFVMVEGDSWGLHADVLP